MRCVTSREPRLIEALRGTIIPGLIDQLCHAALAWRASVEPRRGSVVRSILFDKTPETNWLVPWHQDALIAVAERRDVPGFGPWSMKEGEPHCRPPIEVLESLVTIRIHLDACPTDAGPLRGVIGSHRLGVLSDAAIEAEGRRAAIEGRILEATSDIGDAVIMSPLTIHRSPKSTRGEATGEPHPRRRVLHLDFSTMDLPSGLAWGERVALH
jgi:Phytanoyl-CoA dioxygenase (PhyH)